MFAFTYILSVIKDVETQKNIMLQEHRAENKEVVCCVSAMCLKRMMK